MEDRSLDDFLDAGSDDTDEPGASDATAESGTTGGTGGPAEPAGRRSSDDDPANGSGADETGAADGDGVDAATTQTAGSDDPAAVDVETVGPAVSTYVWSDAGGECAACGATADRRWRQDDELVCPECKAW